MRGEHDRRAGRNHASEEGGRDMQRHGKDYQALARGIRIPQAVLHRTHGLLPGNRGEIVAGKAVRQEQAAEARNVSEKVLDSCGQLVGRGCVSKSR